MQPIVKNLAAIARQYLKVQVKKANLEGNNVDTHLSIFDEMLYFDLCSLCPASSAVANKEASREKADLEKKPKKAEEMAARALNEAKEAKYEAKRLKKELDESKASLEKSKEYSQKVEQRFRGVVERLSGNYPSPFSVELFLVDLKLL